MLTVDHFITTAISLIFYSCLNVACTLKIKSPEHLSATEARDHIGQHISFVHSSLSCFLSLVVYIQDAGIDYESDFSYKYIFVMGHSMGYFTYDLIYAEIFGVHDLAMRFHHACVMVGGYALFFQDKGGSIGILCIALTELSNPCMQVRFILKARKEDNSRLCKISEVLFAALFVFNRGVIGTYLNYNVYQYDVNNVVRVFVSLIYAVSIYWVYIILCKGAKYFKKKELQNPLSKLYVKIFDTLRANQYLVIAGIFTWAIFMPPSLKMLGSTPHHLRLFQFTII